MYSSLDSKLLPDIFSSVFVAGFFIFFQKEGASSCFRCENFVWTWIDDATGC